MSPWRHIYTTSRFQDKKATTSRFQGQKTATSRNGDNNPWDRDSKTFFQKTSHGIEIPRLKNQDIKIPRLKATTSSFHGILILMPPDSICCIFCQSVPVLRCSAGVSCSKPVQNLGDKDANTIELATCLVHVLRDFKVAWHQEAYFSVCCCWIHHESTSRWCLYFTFLAKVFPPPFHYSLGSYLYLFLLYILLSENW